jgi:hypothetical protein
MIWRTLHLGFSRGEFMDFGVVSTMEVGLFLVDLMGINKQEIQKVLTGGQVT